MLKDHLPKINIRKMKNFLIILFLSTHLIACSQQPNKEYKKYWENGKLNELGQLDGDGKKTGEFKFYYEDGILHAKVNYMKGSANGKSSNYHWRSGKLWDEGKYIEGEKTGEWKNYYETGELSSITNYVNGEKSGECKYFYQSGKLWQIGNYQNGKEAGEWNYYDEKGMLIETEKY